MLIRGSRSNHLTIICEVEGYWQGMGQKFVSGIAKLVFNGLFWVS
jgi:hypothetical protein